MSLDEKYKLTILNAAKEYFESQVERTQLVISMTQSLIHELDVKQTSDKIDETIIAQYKELIHYIDKELEQLKK